MKKPSPSTRIRELLPTKQCFGKHAIQQRAHEASAPNRSPARGCFTGLRRSRNTQKGPAAQEQVVERRTDETIEINVGNFGNPLPASSFAFKMPDNALAELGILSGDIALLEPTCRRLRVGDILLVTLDGCDTLRCITKRKSILFLEKAGRQTMLIPLWQHPYQGVVVGILRLFKRIPSPFRQHPVTYVVPSEIELPRGTIVPQNAKAIPPRLGTTGKQK